MNSNQYLDKYVTIKSTDVLGQIKSVTQKHGSSGVLSARFIVHDELGGVHELMPHEVKIHHEYGYE